MGLYWPSKVTGFDTPRVELILFQNCLFHSGAYEEIPGNSGVVVVENFFADLAVLKLMEGKHQNLGFLDF